MFHHIVDAFEDLVDLRLRIHKEEPEYRYSARWNEEIENERNDIVRRLRKAIDDHITDHLNPPR